MIADKEKYIKLKEVIVKEIEGKCDLEKLKNFFKTDIDSPRTFKQIKSVTELIAILEERDVLNYQCPMPLFYIGDVLENETIKYYINVYKKRYLQGEPFVCMCGRELDYYPSTSTSSSSQPEGSCVNIKSGLSNSPNTDLMDAIDIVASRIDFWRVLASELHIEECVVDEIYAKHPKNEKMQAYEALMYWAKREKENATVELLGKALNARLCKRKGIGSHLLSKPRLGSNPLAQLCC